MVAKPKPVCNVNLILFKNLALFQNENHAINEQYFNISKNPYRIIKFIIKVSGPDLGGVSAGAGLHMKGCGHSILASVRRNMA